MTDTDALKERIESDAYCATLGIELVALEPGSATARLEITEELTNFHGTPHGGAVYSLADTAFTAASNSRGETAVGLEANVSYLDSVEVGAVLDATATETHDSAVRPEYEVVIADGAGDRVATFRGRVYKP